MSETRYITEHCYRVSLFHGTNHGHFLPVVWGYYMRIQKNLDRRPPVGVGFPWLPCHWRSSIPTVMQLWPFYIIHRAPSSSDEKKKKQQQYDSYKGPACQGNLTPKESINNWSRPWWMYWSSFTICLIRFWIYPMSTVERWAAALPRALKSIWLKISSFSAAKQPPNPHDNELRLFAIG